MVDHTIVHFEIPAKDAKKLVKFYTDLFGWKTEKSEWMEYWLVETVPVDKQGQAIRQGVNGGMYQKNKETEHMTPVNYINVESVDEYIKKIKALGGKIIVPNKRFRTRAGAQLRWTLRATISDSSKESRCLSHSLLPFLKLALHVLFSPVILFAAFQAFSRASQP